MPSPSAYQCLFCNHPNPAGASFCNECGSQLQLQQCDLCGSINKRSARVCYKCGAAFTFIGASAASATMLDHAAATAVPDHVRTTLPESLVAALGARKTDGDAAGVSGGLPKSSKSSIEDVPVLDSAETRDDALSIVSSAGGGRPSGVAGAAASRFDFRHPLALVAGLLLFVMAAAFIMQGVSESSLPAPSVGTSQLGGETLPTGARSPAAPAGSEVSGNALARVQVVDEIGVPSGAHAATASGGGNADNEAKEARGNSAVHHGTATKACLPNVAALGLCDDAPVREKN